MTAEIGNVDRTASVPGYISRSFECEQSGQGSLVCPASRNRPASSDRRYDAARIDLPDTCVPEIGKVQIARAVHCEPIGELICADAAGPLSPEKPAMPVPA